MGKMLITFEEKVIEICGCHHWKVAIKVHQLYDKEFSDMMYHGFISII